MLPRSVDRFSEPPHITGKQFNSDGMVFSFNFETNTQADVNGSITRIWQDYLNTIVDNATIQYNNGTYTLKAPCIVNTVPEIYPQRNYIFYDTLARAVQRQNTDAPLIRILWQDNFKYTFAMQIVTENNAERLFLLMQKSAETNILNVFHPNWQTCFVNARWLPFTFEHVANVTDMVASFTFDSRNTSSSKCKEGGASAHPTHPTVALSRVCRCLSQPTRTRLHAKVCATLASKPRPVPRANFP